MAEIVRQYIMECVECAPVRKSPKSRAPSIGLGPYILRKCYAKSDTDLTAKYLL